MPGCNVWDLVKVPFSYTNRAVRQRRPALVVAMPQTPGGPALLWVLMVTSAANRGWPGDLAIADHAAAGLPAPSIVRVAKIATIAAGDAKPIGRLAAHEQVQVAQMLQDCLGLVLDERRKLPSSA